jgi:hypothetical protein
MTGVRAGLRKLLWRLGYEVRAVPKGYDPTWGYVLYRYCRADGSFDLDAYRRAQAEGNKRKLDAVWVIEENVRYLARQIERRLGRPRFGLCHGTRRGLEQAWFRKYLGGCEVLGTEISDTAAQFPHTIQWDFHEVKPEWVGAADFVYSNSLDHSHDPQRCLDAWTSCLRPNGLCILEDSPLHGPEGASPLDPFGAELVQMPYLIATWGRGRYCVREILPAPRKRPGLASLDFLLVLKF